MDNEIKKFLETNRKSHFLQSPEWAKVKKEWAHEEIIIKNEEGKIVGYASILLRKMPKLKRYIMYVPRGPVWDIENEEVFLKIIEEMKKIAKKYKAFILRMDPDISNENEEFKNLAIKAGFKIKKNIKDINQVIQPKYVFRLDIANKTEEELLKSFHEKTRYNIRLSTRKGVTVREGTKEDIDIFYNIMKITGTRDNFFIRPKEYFERIFTELGTEHVKLYIAEYEGKPISAVMPIKYGNKVWYLYGGSSNEHRNLMPNYLLQWEMIKWGVNSGCEIYDFRGVSGFKDTNDPQYGIYKFKKGFNGDFVEFVNELYIEFNPFINRVFNIAEKIYKKIK